LRQKQPTYEVSIFAKKLKKIIFFKFWFVPVLFLKKKIEETLHFLVSLSWTAFKKKASMDWTRNATERKSGLIKHRSGPIRRQRIAHPLVQAHAAVLLLFCSPFAVSHCEKTKNLHESLHQGNGTEKVKQFSEIPS
jgi:hypothetical protein